MTVRQTYSFIDEVMLDWKMFYGDDPGLQVEKCISDQKNHIFLFLNTILCEIFDCTTVTEIGMHLRVIIKRVNASISRRAKTDVV